MDKGLFLGLLAALIFLSLIGWIGLFNMSKPVFHQTKEKTRLKYFVYLILVILHLVLIIYFLRIFRIFSFITMGVGLVELLRILVIHRDRIHRHTLFIIIILFILIMSGYVGFIFLSAEKILFLYLVVVVFDGFSQVAGQVFGKKKILNRISPGKTLEGLSGGIIIALSTGFLLGHYEGVGFLATLGKCLVILSFAFLGDLLASLVKRMVGVKDFSKMIPGHGGVLDRFDSLFLAGSVYYFINILQQLGK